MGGQGAVIEIHDQKRDIVHHVSGAQRRVELDAVEDQYAPVELAHVAQMQVAVTIHDLAGTHALGKQRGMGAQEFLRPRAQACMGRGAHRAADVGPGLVEVLHHRSTHAVDAAELVNFRAARGAA